MLDIQFRVIFQLSKCGLSSKQTSSQAFIILIRPIKIPMVFWGLSGSNQRKQNFQTFHVKGNSESYMNTSRLTSATCEAAGVQIKFVVAGGGGVSRT